MTSAPVVVLLMEPRDKKKKSLAIKAEARKCVTLVKLIAFQAADPTWPQDSISQIQNRCETFILLTN